MRLLSASINGYGRIVKSKINLDSKVIAIIGPNEAGKTTILRALRYLSAGKSLPPVARSRAIEVGDDVEVVSADFSLDDDDAAAISDIALDEPPARLTISRTAAGSRYVSIKPYPRKPRRELLKPLEVIERYLKDNNFEDFMDTSTVYFDPGSDAARDVVRELTDICDRITEVINGDQPEESERQIANAEGIQKNIIDGAEDLIESLEVFVEWMRRDSPESAVREILYGRRPQFLLFTEEERVLQSSYNIDDNLAATQPPGLANLLALADLNISMLLQHIKNGDVARRQTLLNQANGRLEKIFRSSWKQANLTVQLLVDGPTLRVVIWEGDSDVTPYDERSAGLKMFICLIGFLANYEEGRPVVLLIDEAENHLHIDAQADLVNMFALQDRAARVVYTTHSPACLPSDLGVGVRSVVPSTENLQISDVRNSFWRGSGGYSPLMLAMGAAAAAYTPARRVVLAEGATEMMMLPSMVRIATNEESLVYQVAPGLSEVPADMYPKLDLEGSRVAYLVDGDKGGLALKRGLQRAGVSPDRIVVLKLNGIENALDPECYREAVHALMVESNQPGSVPSMPILENPLGDSWAKEMEKFAALHELKFPSKSVVACWIVENRRVRLNEDGRGALIAAHKLLMRILE